MTLAPSEDAPAASPPPTRRPSPCWWSARTLTMNRAPPAACSHCTAPEASGPASSPAPVAKRARSTILTSIPWPTSPASKRSASASCEPPARSSASASSACWATAILACSAPQATSTQTHSARQTPPRPPDASSRSSASSSRASWSPSRSAAATSTRITSTATRSAWTPSTPPLIRQPTLEAGPPWQIDKLYAVAQIDDGRWDALIPEFEALGLDVSWLKRRSDRAERHPGPEAATVALDVRPYTEIQRRALLSHRTQIKPDGFWAILSEDLRRRAFSTAYFMRLHPAAEPGRARAGPLRWTEHRHRQRVGSVGDAYTSPAHPAPPRTDRPSATPSPPATRPGAISWLLTTCDQCATSL